MGPLGGGQEAVAGWAPWGRRGDGGGEGEDGGSKPRGHPIGALGRGWGSVKDGGSRHFLPIPPTAACPPAEQRIPDSRECRAQAPQSRRLVVKALCFFLLHAEFDACVTLHNFGHSDLAAPLLRVRMTPLPTPQRLRVRLGVPRTQTGWLPEFLEGPSAAPAPQDVCFLTLFTFCRLNSGRDPLGSALAVCLVSSTRDSGEPPLNQMLGNQA